MKKIAKAKTKVMKPSGKTPRISPAQAKVIRGKLSAAGSAY